jgi:hypothetical protein
MLAALVVTPPVVCASLKRICLRRRLTRDRQPSSSIAIYSIRSHLRVHKTWSIPDRNSRNTTPRCGLRERIARSCSKGYLSHDTLIGFRKKTRANPVCERRSAQPIEPNVSLQKRSCRYKTIADSAASGRASHRAAFAMNRDSTRAHLLARNAFARPAESRPKDGGAVRFGRGTAPSAAAPMPRSLALGGDRTATRTYVRRLSAWRLGAPLPKKH